MKRIRREIGIVSASAIVVVSFVVPMFRRAHRFDFLRISYSVVFDFGIQIRNSLYRSLSRVRVTKPRDKVATVAETRKDYYPVITSDLQCLA